MLGKVSGGLLKSFALQAGDVAVAQKQTGVGRLLVNNYEVILYQ